MRRRSATWRYCTILSNIKRNTIPKRLQVEAAERHVETVAGPQRELLKLLDEMLEQPPLELDPESATQVSLPILYYTILR